MTPSILSHVDSWSDSRLSAVGRKSISGNKTIKLVRLMINPGSLL